MNRLLVALVAATSLLLSGCAASESSGQSKVSSSTGAGQVNDVLASHGLEGLDTVELVDRLDRLAGEDRPTELIAAVLPEKLVLTAGKDELSRDLPADLFYLSVAPYTSMTHDCFNHSLTTCTGELADTPIELKVVDQETGKVLVDEERSTFANGFVGLWLPRDIEATLTIASIAGRGSVNISTATDAPTCLTTLKLT